MILRILQSSITHTTLGLFFFINHTVKAHDHAIVTQADASIVWALNVGGDSYLGKDGIEYQADTSPQAGKSIDFIKGTQDQTVFKRYKVAPKPISKPLSNGYYDLIFKFAEPKNKGVGKRVFNVIVEGKTVINDLDIALARDGNVKSSLVRMVSDVNVTDGVLDVSLEPVIGQPILNALIVRKKVPRSADWVMVWNDEFNYSGAPDANKWNHDIWPAKKVNNEDQAYTDRLKNVRVGNGLLTIEAHREDYFYSEGPDSSRAEYTSGRIHSAGKGDLLYGRAEVRAKLPSGQGTWPAIWMLPSNPFKYATSCVESEEWQGSSSCDAWPNSGEIDIMEHVGYDLNRVHGTVHNRAYYWVNGQQRKSSVEADNVDQEFHTYSIEWSPERIDVFYDDSLYFTYLNQGEGWQAWPYDHPFHIILNVAVGGGWGGAGGATDLAAFPATMQVDYVRLYQNQTKNIIY